MVLLLIIGAVEQHFAFCRDEVTEIIIIGSLVENEIRVTAEVMNLFITENGLYCPQVLPLQLWLVVTWWNQDNVVCVILVENLFYVFKMFLYIFINCWLRNYR